MAIGSGIGGVTGGAPLDVLTSRTGARETLLRRAVLVVAIGLSCVLGYVTSYVLLLLAGAATLHFATRRPTIPFAFDRPARLFLAGFAVLFALAMVATPEPFDLLAMLGFAALLLFAPLALLLGRGATPANAGKVASFALAGTAAGLGFALLYLLLSGMDRAGDGALITDPIRLAHTALILGFLSLLGLVAAESRRRWIYLLGPAMALAVIFACGSRAALLVYPLLLVVSALLLVRRRGPALALGTGVVALFVIVTLVGDVLGARSSTLFDIIARLLAGTGPSDGETSIRFVLYRAGWAAFLDAPFLGHGWGATMQAIVPYLGEAERRYAAFPHLHNDALQFAVAAGLPGLVAYLALLATPVLCCRATPRDSQYRARLYGAVLLTVSYLVLGLPDTMLANPLHLTLYVTFTALLLGYCRDFSPSPKG